MRILVFVGPRIVEICDDVSVRRYIGAPNAELVRKRKTGQIVQVNLKPHGDDSLRPSLHDDAGPTYREQVGPHPLVEIKRLNPATGQLVRWSDRDKFNPRRFNPDAIPTSVISDRRMNS
jgi:hypothetical protein